MGRVMEVNTVNLFGNFAYKFKGEIYHQQIGGPKGTQSATLAALIAMEKHWKKWKNRQRNPDPKYTTSVTESMWMMEEDGGSFSGQVPGTRMDNLS